MDESSSSSSLSPSSLSPSSTSPIPTGPPFLSTIFAPSSPVVSVTPSIPIPPTSSSLPTTLASSVFSHPVFSVTNIRNYVAETLDHTNFFVWKELMIPVLQSKGVYGHVDGSDSGPSPNSPDFDSWMQVDYQVLSWIQATISKDILQFILQPGKQLTAKLAWESIHQLYQSQLSATALQLTQEFSGIQKQSGQSVMDYLQYVKGLSDRLFGIGHPVSDKDLVLRTIAGLDHSFSVAKRTIPQHVPFPTFLELRLLLLIEEANILQESSTSSLMNGSSSSSQLLQLTHPSDLQIHYAAPLQRGRGFGRNNTFRGGRTNRGRGSRGSGRTVWNHRSNFSGHSSFGRGFGNVAHGASDFSTGYSGTHGAGFNGSLFAKSDGQVVGFHSANSSTRALPPLLPTSPTPIACQWCNRLGHQARDCSFLTARPASASSAPQSLYANLVPAPMDPNWYFDNGAQTHATNNPGKLLHSTPSSSSNFIQVGNGQLLPVTSHGNAFLFTSNSQFRLNNVLVAPHLTKNLVSVRQFTRDNNCSVNFDSFGFSIKDNKTKNVLLRWNSPDGLYSFSSGSFPSYPAVYSVSHSPDVWHCRLGHPGITSIQHLARRGLLPIERVTLPPRLCHACQLGKHVRLPFSESCSFATKPFELIHSDVWTSPTLSFSGIKYYLLFLDEYSHYLWVYPLSSKAQVFDSFLKFSTFVSTQFGAKIKALPCDNGREFDNSQFASYFHTHGIHLRSSCPSTPQQNGKAERMNRTIMNMVRSLLFQANLPGKFWVEAIYVAVHLLNILPTSRLHFLTPHEVFFGSPPKYDHLRTFGCACYPNMSATTPHKLAPRFTLCIFLGYPAHHKGYRCLDLATNKIIISRHVVFYETSFPYTYTAPVSSPLPHFRSPFHLMDFPPIKPISKSSLAQNHDLPVSTTSLSPFYLLLHHCRPLLSQSLILYHPLLLPCPYHLFSSSTALPSLPPSKFSPSSTDSPHPLVELPASHATPSMASCSLPLSPASSLPPSLQPPRHIHPMITRSQVGTRKPQVLPSLLATGAAIREPKTFKEACQFFEWRSAMKADGSIERFKARLVAQGFTQQQGIDYDDTFSPVVKPVTIRTVLALAVMYSWPIHQLDVKNAFLHGRLSEVVYMSQPPGFIDPQYPDYVCRLNRALYGLKQAPRAWFQRFASFLFTRGFSQARSDSSMFLYHSNGTIGILLLYVDDIVLTASTTVLLHDIISLLKREFLMTDLGQLNYFLGISVSFNSDGLFLSQSKYTHELLERSGMLDYKPVVTPMAPKAKLFSTDSPAYSDPAFYRSIVGALQYLTFTRPDIAFAVGQVCQHMHAPTHNHFTVVKRILRYLKGTLNYGLQLFRNSSLSLHMFTDADWAGCVDTRRSISGYCLFLGNSLISWSSKKQNTIARSNAEAEYRAIANAVAEVIWVRQLLSELHVFLHSPPMVYCDNINAIYMSLNPVQHQRTKHIEIDIHFVREHVASGIICIQYVPSSAQRADVLTKALSSALFRSQSSSFCATIMAGKESEYDGASDSDLVSDQSLKLQHQSTHLSTTANAAAGGLEITCFSEVVDDATFHFQIIRFPKQIYAWIGCNSTKFGDLYAAASTRPSNTVGVTSILGGSSDNTGSGIARPLVLKTGLNIILACSIPKNSPMLEV
ncbi:hypothetical protein SLEP1_g57319 [Rubroshorea leprosula]|uniref:Integrase catalytic domain-containing protein n=1 Tax=Rubroshorea leprosula TaxID=152421 RepID=A0AAV5MNP6_9ROSI|nr:hypothetical protein SLEP1_g57319 [Rubroshorea leprosula]